MDGEREEGGGGGAGEGVVGDDSVVLGDGRRGPGEDHLPLSRDSLESLGSTTWS